MDHQSLRDSSDGLDTLILNFLNFDNGSPSTKTEPVKQLYLRKFTEAEIPGAEKLKSYEEIRPLVTQYLADIEDKRKTQTKRFHFETTTLDEQSVKKDLADLGYLPEDYIVTIGVKQHIRLSQKWINYHLPKYATQNNDDLRSQTPVALKDKYVPKNKPAGEGKDTDGKTFEISSNNNIVPHMEGLSVLVYSDPVNKIVDWTETLELLQRYGKSNSYSQRQLKSAILRIVTKHQPDDIPFYRDLSPDSIATKLLQSQPRINPRLQNFGKLKSTKRPIGTPLAAVLQRAQSIIEQINAPTPENASKNLNLYLAALLSFTNGELRSNLQKYISDKQSSGKNINWLKLRNFAIEQETNDPNLIPTTELVYSQEICGKQTVGMFSIKTEQEIEELQPRRFQKPTQQKPLWISNSNKPHVYWQLNDTSFRIDMEQLNPDMQKQVMQQDGKYHTAVNDKLIGDLSNQLERAEISNEIHEQAIFRGSLNQSRKIDLIKNLDKNVSESSNQTIPSAADQNTQEYPDTRLHRKNTNNPIQPHEYAGVHYMTQNRPMNYDKPNNSNTRNGFDKNVISNERETRPSYSRDKSSDSRNRPFENRDRNQRQDENNQHHGKPRSDQNFSTRDTSRYDKYKNENRESRQSNNERDKSYYNKSSSNYDNRDRRNSNHRSSSDNRNGSTTNYSRNTYSKDNSTRNNSRDNYSRNDSGKKSSTNSYSRSDSGNRYSNNNYYKSNSGSRYPTNNYSRNDSSNRYSTTNYPRNSSSNRYSRSNSGNRYPTTNYSRNDSRNRYTTNSYSRNGSANRYSTDYSRNGSGPRYSRDNYSRSRSNPKVHDNPRNDSRRYTSHPRSISRNNTYYSRRYDTDRTQSSRYDNNRERFNRGSSRDSRYNNKYQSRTPTSSPYRQNGRFSSRNYSASPSRQTGYYGQNSRPYSSTSRNRGDTYSEHKPIQRSQTMAMCIYKNMKPSLNCNKDYNPLETKICSKCLSEDHHEFSCPLYLKYNKEMCKHCNRGFHDSSECTSRQKNSTIVQELINNEDFKQMLGKN